MLVLPLSPSGLPGDDCPLGQAAPELKQGLNRLCEIVAKRPRAIAVVMKLVDVADVVRHAVASEQYAERFRPAFRRSLWTSPTFEKLSHLKFEPLGNHVAAMNPFAIARARRGEGA